MKKLHIRIVAHCTETAHRPTHQDPSRLARAVGVSPCKSRASTPTRAPVPTSRGTLWGAAPLLATAESGGQSLFDPTALMAFFVPAHGVGACCNCFWRLLYARDQTTGRGCRGRPNADMIWTVCACTVPYSLFGHIWKKFLGVRESVETAVCERNIFILGLKYPSHL